MMTPIHCRLHYAAPFFSSPEDCACHHRCCAEQVAGRMAYCDVELCTIGALALHLFAKFHRGAIPLIDPSLEHGAFQFPDFSSNETWYDLKLFSDSKLATHEMHYDTQNKNWKSAFARVGNRLGLGLGRGHPPDAIDWSSTATCYLSKLPRQAMRSLAGFSIEGGDYWIAHDVPVHENLFDNVFAPVSSALSTLSRQL